MRAETGRPKGWAWKAEIQQLGGYVRLSLPEGTENQSPIKGRIRGQKGAEIWGLKSTRKSTPGGFAGFLVANHGIGKGTIQTAMTQVLLNTNDVNILSKHYHGCGVLQSVRVAFLGGQPGGFSIPLEKPKELGPVQFPSLLAGKEKITTIGGAFLQPCRQSAFFVKERLAPVGQEGLHGPKAVLEPGNRQIAVFDIGLLNCADFRGSQAVFGSQEQHTPIAGGILPSGFQDPQQFFLVERYADIRHNEITSTKKPAI
jgi:hypothetical protein